MVAGLVDPSQVARLLGKEMLWLEKQKLKLKQECKSLSQLRDEVQCKLHDLCKFSEVSQMCHLLQLHSHYSFDAGTTS